MGYVNDFSPTNDFSLHESCQIYKITQYKASNCCKIEAAIIGVLEKKCYNLEKKVKNS